MPDIKIKPPGRINGLNKYKVKSARLKNTNGQTMAPPHYGHDQYYVPIKE
ncbi:MAG: hypothetical protein WCY82_07135 [Desulfotomaculaceae bacterium]